MKNDYDFSRGERNKFHRNVHCEEKENEPPGTKENQGKESSPGLGMYVTSLGTVFTRSGLFLHLDPEEP